MEEQKLVKRKKKTLTTGNRRSIAEACNNLGSFYFKHERYDEALEEFSEEAAICEDLGLKMEWGTSNRMIGETYMMMAEFDKALKYEEKHLEIAKELGNQVEEQRAMATLGRMYLLQGQSITDCPKSAACLKAAEKAFMKSLVLCEGLKGKVGMHEIMDMRARLLLNIGVVLEHLGSVEKAVTFMHKAISICANQDLYEMLHQCYLTEAHLHSSKTKDYAQALGCLNKAIEVASRLEDKVLKQCETLSLKADILCKMADYQSAKQVLLKAWKLDTPSEEDKKVIERNLKIVAAICYTEDLILGTSATDHATLKSLQEKLGDGACALQNYPAAAEAYQRMLQHAEAGGESGKTLIPIYVSLYQTYKDMGMYEEALQYYDKEYELIKDEPKEAYVTLCNIAETRFLAKKPYEQIEEACEEARVMAAKLGHKYKVRLLKRLLQYQKVYLEEERMDDTKAELKLLGYFDLDDLDNSEDESSGTSQENDTPDIGDEICIEDLTDVSDNNEEETTEHKKDTRRRGRSFTIKKNAKGETQLHVACISGNKLLVERLLSSGHPVNVRDNAGWLPLHEACIHGHRLIAEMLVDRGAHINDRGGSDCDGITPMYDAACNGHLEIVDMLIDKGAITSLRTDFGETALDALRKWRKGNILNKEEEILYKDLCNKICNCLEKRPVEELNKSISKSPLKNHLISPPSTSKTLISDDKDLSVFKRRNRIDDEDSFDEIDIDRINSDNSSDISDDNVSRKPNKKKNSGVNEYMNAISALRNRNAPEEKNDDIEVKKTKSRPALLAPEEVDDDWLDDDLGTNKNKKRKVSDDSLLITASKKPSLESVNKSLENINKIDITDIDRVNKSNSDRSSITSKSRYSDVIDSDNSSDENFIMTENVNPKPNSVSDLLTGKIINLDDTKISADSRQNIKRRYKRQSTLFRAGFRRNRDNIDCSSNSNSDNEISTIKSCTPRKSHPPSISNLTMQMLHERISSPRKNEISKSINSLSRHSSNEYIVSPKKVESSRSSTSNFSRKSSNEFIPSVIHSHNTIQSRNLMHQAQSSGLHPQIMPPAAVRVKVEDKVLLISLNFKTINKLSISWLVEEVKNRYYKLTGVRPVFSLMTSDGAILSEEDPLSLVLTSPELQTCITNWKASPAEERYLECCAALNVVTSREIQQAIGRSHNTHRLALGSGTLDQSQIKPLFRALTHQTHLTALMLSDNNLCDNGCFILIDCLCTLKMLTHLDISMNNVTSEGVKSFLNMFVKSSRPVCQNLEQINLSCNPIGDAGFRHLMEMTSYVNLKALRVNNCNITENALHCPNKPQMSLDQIEIFDVSNNNVKQILLEEILLKLNPALLTEIELENIGVKSAEVSIFLGKFFEHAPNIRLKKLNLSKCSLTDGDFMKFYRYLMRGKNLQSMILKSNSLTFITLKKLLRRQPPVPQISVEGCADIFKYSLDSDFPIWLPSIDFGPCIPEINVTTATDGTQREGFKCFSKLWLNCFKGRGIIEHGDDGIIKFTAK